MSLATYHKKRHFNRTPEPKGKAERARKSGLAFVIQKHDASRLHYDFRLELDGVLKSWAVPKGPSLDPSRKALAVQVEDHPVDYGDFEGTIPQGEYGGGTVLLWDRGTWEPIGDARDSLARGNLKFILHGEKLHGEWHLVQMHGRSGGDGENGGKNWLLFKAKDKYASKKDVLKDDASVKTKRSLDEIAGDKKHVWKSNRKRQSSSNQLPTEISPQLAVLVEDPPQGKEWLHEIKFDGYRLLAFIDKGDVRLMTRNGKDWTAKFSAIAKSLEKLKVENAILDGEAVVIDDQGRSDFQALQALLKDKKRAALTYFVFDLLFINGHDIREKPLIERKKRLKEILSAGKLEPRVRFSDHVQGDGEKVIERACSMALEGIVSKQADAPYVSRRDSSWQKSKCGMRQEFVVIGWTDPQGSRTGFGSLLLGYHDEKKQLVYAGRVGTGFNDRLLSDLHKQLQALAQKEVPTDIAPPSRERRNAHWVSPKLVAEVQFTGWTRDGMLRHPVFMGLRTDKPAKQIVREKPVHTNGAADQSTRAQPAKEKSKGEKSKGYVPFKSPADSFAGVRFTHPEKVLYPDSGTTKLDIAQYYEIAQKWMLPYVIYRPLALVRSPGGIGGSAKQFFQRNWKETMPKAIGKVDISDSKKRDEHVAINDFTGLISLVQIDALEIHTWNCTAKDVEHADQLIFDLDPGPDVSWKQIVTAARDVRKAVHKLRLPTFLKTSGGKGLHITIPIKANIDWDSAKSFCETIAKSLVEESDLFVANMRKDLRGGKVYIDYHRNGRFATAVAPYSTRARAGAPVSMPISWEELGKIPSAAHFTVDTARQYLKRRKADPWREFERSRIDLRKLVARRAAA